MSKNILNAYILLDRSASMISRWEETINSINAYVEELAKNDKKALVSLAAFDGGEKLEFDLLRDAQVSGKWNKVSTTEAAPRGMTPLFDAIGKIVTLAEKADNKKTVIIILTDGAENNSKEITKEAAKKMLDRCRAKDWEVIFLGADFNAFGEAQGLGNVAGKVLNMTVGNYSDSMRSLGTKTAFYASANVSMQFSDKDREDASKIK